MARLVVIAPGRGSYNRSELGYLNRFQDHKRFPERQALVAQADQYRRDLGRITPSQLDGAKQYNPQVHLPGENASGLILTCAAADYAMIDPSHQVVATLGNSMGWYITLFTGGALGFGDAMRIVDTMGNLQKNNIRGGQIIYPVVNSQWQRDGEAEERVEQTLADIRAKGESYWVGHSIRLGGFLVLAGTDKGIRELLGTLPKITMGSATYPFQLAGHSAFHTSLMKEASDLGTYHLNNTPWREPQVPMIDGRGAIWRKFQTEAEALRDYTLQNQVLEPYDFTCSLRVALREYNPDHLVLLGPGETLGGAIAHVLISEGWWGIHSKADFMAAQKGTKPPLIAMNRPDQATLII